ncbi:ankyrin-2-like [Lolium rigidum]|uniref:ankyrin-2-like n=1 Tax=Lolium rigidum TaxID=89674 RepID=UPI001F5D0E8F|nr:ankyrin-2-like [Lolium rigidum]
MGTRDMPLPRQFEFLLGKDRDQWPLEARFIEAAHDGDVRSIKKIAKELDVHGHGVPVTVASTTYMGFNALHAAGGRGRLPLYQYLVEELKMDVNKPDTSQDQSPAEHAVTYGNLPAVAYLLDHGADLHQKRQGDVTLLHSAAIRGHSEIVEFLLSRGADVNALSVTGTPLSVASFKGHASTVKILLQHNANPNKGNRLFVALDMALRKSFVSCVKLLIQGGANVSSASPGDNPLVKAAEKGLTEAIKCLLEAGANANVLDMYGRLPIELAAEYGTREDVEILFPFTSPISTVANWSVDGIISHVKMEIKQLEDGDFVKTRMSELKGQGDEAFKNQDYLKASVFYTQALKMDNFDAKLLSNRSLCFLRMGDGKRAYEDATECAEIRPKWAKAHYRLGAAFMCMKGGNGTEELNSARQLQRAARMEREDLFWSC